MCNNNKSTYGLSKNIITSPADNDIVLWTRGGYLGWRDLMLKMKGGEDVNHFIKERVIKKKAGLFPLEIASMHRR
jgi:hypothetical protein